ncbi:MAG: YkgJ family cysteine cluster protein [Nitrospirae bacterium]|nr:YkgJ family cysteine cluster protein [Nitrospirota bacterium]
MTGSSGISSCQRCGQCCQKHTPSLHKADLRLLKKGVLSVSKLYTLRVGEPVFDNIKGKQILLQDELIKIREDQDTGACIFYDHPGLACTIYEQRPIQCRSFECWNENKLKTLFKTRKLNRMDVVEEQVIIDLIKAHESRVPFRKFFNLLTISKPSPDIENQILDLINYDLHFRKFVSDRLSLSKDELDFYFGRSLIECIKPLGFKLSGSAEQGYILEATES